MTDSMAKVISGTTATITRIMTRMMATGKFALPKLILLIWPDLPVTVVNCLRLLVTFWFKSRMPTPNRIITATMMYAWPG